MKRLVAEQTAIARRYRDAGHQYWGRIIGTDADHETASWMAAQLRRAGADVRLERLDLPPQWVPRSWEAAVSRPGEVVTLASASPTYASPGTPSEGIDVELIDVGLGMKTDFRGRDVRDKAVIIHAIPRPGIISLMRSTTLRCAIERIRCDQVSLSGHTFIVICSFLIETFRRCSVACGKPRPWRFSIAPRPRRSTRPFKCRWTDLAEASSAGVVGYRTLRCRRTTPSSRLRMCRK